MALVATDNRYYTEIANAIREKNGSSDKYTPAQMAEAILAISGGGSGVLPAGYIQLEYIESTDTQYIGTGIKPNQDTRIVLDFQITDTATRHLFGARTTSATNLFFAACMSAATIRVDYRTEQKTFTVGSVLNRMTLDFNKNIVTLGGVSQSYTKSTFTPDLEMPLFTSNSGGSITSDTYKAKMKLYSCQIYDNGTLVRDYIPCKHPNGTIGLYDIANGVFYGNSGAGMFYGAMPRELPDGYTQANYIESSGTQYIDTGFKPNGNTRTVCDFQMTKAYSASKAVFGARTSGTTQLNVFYHIATNEFRIDYYGNTQRIAVTNDLARMTVDKNKNVTTLDGNTLTYTAVTTATDSNMFLFATSNAGSVASQASVKIYSCQIYDNGVMVRDFVPCKNSGGSYGLYDMVTKQFYGNAGTGTFTGA